MSTTTEDLPEYAVTVAVCGNPQPVIDELTEWLDEQTAPQIQPDEKPEPAEGEETDETSGAEDD